MQKALIYCRVSSERQKTEGHGLDSQEHRCREYAAQSSYEIEEIFRDSFTGGGDFMKRPAMRELLAYLDKRPHQQYVIIFDDLKRFARDTVFHWNLRSALKVRNATPKCLNYDFSEDPEGRFVETIFAAQNQLEREQNRRQVVQKMKARVEMGYWCLPCLALGYKHQKKTSGSNSVPAPHEPEASIVKDALEGFASGRFTEQVDVQRFLHEARLKGDKEVYLECVKRILQNSIFYAGYIEYPKWEVSLRKGQHQPLISLATHERIQEKLSGKVRTFKKNLLNPDFPLRGFALCYACRGPMTASWSTGRNGKFGYYRCKTKGCTERNKSVAKETIEKEFCSILGKIKPSQNVLELTKAVVRDVWKKKEQDIFAQQKAIQSELNKIEIERERLLERISRATDDKVIETYEVRLGKLAEQELVSKNSLMSLGQHKPNVETALEIVFDFLKNPLAQWRKGDMQRKKLLLKLVFEERLAYNRKSGFETALLSLPLRIFCLPEAQKSRLVEMAGIEPACNERRMHASTEPRLL